MEEINSLKLLDNLLNTFLEKEKYKASVYTLGEPDNLTWVDTIMALDYLIDEDYVKKEHVQFKEITDEITAPIYYLTFKGKVFRQIGYVQSYMDAKRKKERLILKDNLMIFGTWLAGIGSLSYVVWEIGKHFHWWN